MSGCVGGCVTGWESGCGRHHRTRVVHGRQQDPGIRTKERRMHVTRHQLCARRSTRHPFSISHALSNPKTKKKGRKQNCFEFTENSFGHTSFWGSGKKGSENP